MNVEDQYNEEFNNEEFINYIGEMKQLNTILFNLKDLADYFNHKQDIFRYRFVYGYKSENRKHAKYFRKQNIENDKRNYEYIRSMFQYVIQEQKVLIDNILSKFKIEQIDINNEDKKEKIIIFDKYNRFNSEEFNNYVNEMDKLQEILIKLNNLLYSASGEITILEGYEDVKSIVNWYNDLENVNKENVIKHVDKVFKKIVLEQKYRVDRVKIENRV